MNECFKVAPRYGDTPPSPEDAHRVGVMRRIAAARLRHCGLDAMADDVTFIVSELLTNALLHSGTTEISLSISVGDGSLRIVVYDGMPGNGELKNVDDNAESGRGISLVDALVREGGGTWGISDAGATTWCCLSLPGAGDAPCSEGAASVQLRLAPPSRPYGVTVAVA